MKRMYTVGDFLIRIKNAYKARKKEITYPYSKLCYSVGKILEREGSIKSISKKKIDDKDSLYIELMYKGRKAAFRDVDLVSKPSIRIYVKRQKLMKRGGNLVIVSTNRGVMTDKEAQKAGVGGELICKIY